MPSVARIDVYPVKGLDRCRRSEAAVLPGGTLEHDRTYALRDEDGEVINGKRTDQVHDVDAEFVPSTGTLSVGGPDGEAAEFVLPEESEAAAAWFETVFEPSLTLDRAGETGFVDRPSMGPSLISTATLEEVASWYDGVDLDGARRRFRANVEIEGVPAFWEDRLVGPEAPDLQIGDVRLTGETPCGRCVVPARDPDTGEPIEGFRERFVERREETFPAWADRRAFDHFYTLMVIASIDDAPRGASIVEGAEVRLLS